MEISIIGTGYVGLVQGACFSDTGNSVMCMDIDEKKIANLKRGIIPIYEPGLEEIVRRNTQEKRLEFTSSLKSAVEHGKIIFLCLPTPQSEDGAADLSRVIDVAEQIATQAIGYKIIVSKSTVPVGTVDKIRQIMRKKGKLEIDVVSNPEFLKEGSALEDSLKPERIVIGTKSRKAITILSDIYAPFLRTGNPILVMDERSAEMTKYAANSFLAMKISYMNELANLCERSGADIDWVRKGIGSDPRINQQFLFAGIGYGGSCFPKDIKALIKTAQENEYEFKILRAVDEVNDKQKRVIVKKMQKHFNNQLQQKIITIWGLSFKPQTDDIREAPSLVIINSLLEAGARVRAHDPIAIPRVKALFGSKVEFFDNNYDSLKGADALTVVTEWNEFRRPDFERMKSLMKRPVIFDGRNIYDPKLMREKGFTYFGIGRNGE
ncbi:MAG TPA: UDP-glucose/GDP-mannose dehydrogenase family protein [Bacteroidota bacterium]|nr:UDP-glucose/GDP-mannose dehydrogenase family protein [Bacteroidota bacterium]